MKTVSNPETSPPPEVGGKEVFEIPQGPMLCYLPARTRLYCMVIENAGDGDVIMDETGEGLRYLTTAGHSNKVGQTVTCVYQILLPQQ